MRYALMESKQLVTFALSFSPMSKLKCSSVKYVKKFCSSSKTYDKFGNKLRQKTSESVSCVINQHLLLVISLNNFLTSVLSFLYYFLQTVQYPLTKWLLIEGDRPKPLLSFKLQTDINQQLLLVKSVPNMAILKISSTIKSHTVVQNKLR